MSSPDRLSHALETGQLEMPQGPVLVLRAQASPGLFELSDVIAEQSNRPSFESLKASGIEVSKAVSGTFPSTLVNLTRIRAESLALIARAWDMLSDGGLFIINGSKTDGVDSILKSLRTHIEIDQVIPKAHGKLITATKTSATLPDWANALKLTQNADGFMTAAGMFSADGIDPGSELLARHFPNRLKGSVADLGAGWGWLGHAALDACPAIERITLIEAEDRALDAARLNIQDERAKFEWADATKVTGSYDAVITNPPFHADRKPDPSLGLAFIRSAAKLLKPNGKLMLVANRMLPYEESLDQLFRRVERREQTNRFKVFEATKPR